MARRERFTWFENDVVFSQCVYCENLRPYKTCLAYQEGIPQEIINNDVDHRQPYKGDNGIQFKKAKGMKINNKVWEK